MSGSRRTSKENTSGNERQGRSQAGTVGGTGQLQRSPQAAPFSVVSVIGNSAFGRLVSESDSTLRLGRLSRTDRSDAVGRAVARWRATGAYSYMPTDSVRSPRREVVLDPQSVLDLQERAGNAAVASLLQRQAAATAPVPAGPVAVPTAGAAYTLTIGSETFERVETQQAARLLGGQAQRIHDLVDAGEEGHWHQKEVRGDQPLIGWFADKLGGVSMPPIEMWDEPRRLVARARGALAAGDIVRAGDLLQQAENACRSCERRLYAYREGTIAGAKTGEHIAIGVVVVAGVTEVALTGLAVGAATGAAEAMGGGSAAAEATAGTGAAATGALNPAAAQAVATGEAVAAEASATTAAETVAASEGAAGAASTAAIDASTLMQKVGIMLSQGEGRAVVALLTSLSSTPAGRQLLQLCHQTIAVVMQNPAAIPREMFPVFQMMLNVFGQFARGGG